jgi:pyridoxal phosphate enzyme (YggS family)
MPVNVDQYTSIQKRLQESGATLIAVSKTKPIEDILALYKLGQRDFGENYVQELVEKQAQLPSDIRWHFIGHLQRNKVKYIAPFVHLIHGVDSVSLLKEINKEASKSSRIIDCLLQGYIASEESKFGFDIDELKQAMATLPELSGVNVVGLMGMASFSSDKLIIEKEFKQLCNWRNELKNEHYTLPTLSMGMSSDYEIALAQGSNMVRIGSMLFGAREKRS